MDEKKKRFKLPRKKRTTKRTFKGLKLSHLIILAILLVMVAGASTVGTVILAAMGGLPSLDNTDITDYNVTSYILDKDGTFVDKLSSGANYVAADYNDISPNMVKAVVSVEDKRFYNHHGVDPIRIAGAMVANIKAGGIVQGGSTITQQLAGMIMENRDEKTYKRKIQEAILAVRLENKYSKEEIITAYLNRCYYGIGLSGMSCYGIQAACNDILGKNAADLTPADAALMAGIIQNPTYWSPIANPENAKVRREQVLNAMLANGAIDQQEFDNDNASEIAVNTIVKQENHQTQPYNQSYIDYVIDEAMEILGFKENEENLLYTGGYLIHTSLDQGIQEYMYNYFNNDAYFPGSGVQGAMVVMKSNDSSVVGMIGGRHIEPNMRRSFNRATQSFRQPGSTFKPIFDYGPAFEDGQGTGTVYTDQPFQTNDGHVIRNADLRYHGPVTIRYALQQSLNTVAAQCIQDLGPEKGMEFARKCGISSLVDKTPDGKTDLTISAGLGGLTNGVSVLEMAGAYGAFAHEGVYTKPHAITKITDEDGNVIWQEKPESHRAMSKQTAYMMTDVLQSVVTRGIGVYGAIRDGRPTAGKTGTTDDVKDIWFCGYTPQYVGAVWMGYDQPAVMYSSSDIPAMAFSSIMTYVHQGLEVKSFDRPDGLTDVLIDSKSGKLATRSTPYQYRSMELYKSGTEPTTYSTNTYAEYYYNNKSETKKDEDKKDEKQNNQGNNTGNASNQPATNNGGNTQNAPPQNNPTEQPGNGGTDANTATNGG